MFKAVTTMALDIKKEGNGGPHVGHFIGSSQTNTKLGKQTVWSFADEDGLPFSIYGYTMLNLAMARVSPGALCRVTYRGTQFVNTKFKPSGQNVHQVLVEIDDGDDSIVHAQVGA